MTVPWKVVLVGVGPGDVLIPLGGEPQSTTERVRTQSMCRSCVSAVQDDSVPTYMYSGGYNEIHC